MSIKVGLVSLGCPKNQVDAEMMLSRLCDGGYELVDDTLSADVVVINTCGFIEDAKKEAIDAILEAVQLKEDGIIQKIVVCGCLVQRYGSEILKEIPEVDGVAGLGSNGSIAEVVARVMNDEQVEELSDGGELVIEGERILSTPDHWAYLRIADGCSNCCAYCAIPKIRGPFRSRPMENIIREARELAAGGVKELVIIAQDTTRYGLDLYGELKLPELLTALCEIDGIEWIRLLYCYPDRVTDELLDVMAREDKILNYMDLPLQHADAGILRAMNRTGSPEELLALIEKIRSRLPGVVLRTTLIAGFPGEGEEEFEVLCKFIDDARFERLGCFAYSREEETPAYDMDGQLSEDEKAHRAEIVMEQQDSIFAAVQESYIGTVQRCVVEDYDPYTDSYTGRTWMDAPEIDSIIYLTSPYEVAIGTIIDAEITDVEDFNFIGRIKKQ